MNNTFEIGQEVASLYSDSYGARGTVIEINESGRVRVKWDAGIRTWHKQAALTPSARLSDGDIATYHNNRRLGRRAAAVKVAPKPAAEPKPFARARFTVEMTQEQNCFNCFNIRDNAINKTLLQEDMNMHAALAIAVRLERSKQPEKMLARILAAGDVNA